MKKTLKKMITIMLILVILASMSLSAFAVPSYTIDTGDAYGLVPVKEVLFSESFDGSDATRTAIGTSSANPLSVISRASDSTDGTKNFLWINNISEANKEKTPYYILKSENVFEGEYAIEFKFNKTQNHTVDAGKATEKTTDVMFFGAGYTDGTNKNLAIKLGIDKDDKPYYVDKNGDKQYFINSTDHAWTTGFKLNSYWTWDEGDWFQKAASGVTADFAKKTADWYVVKVLVNTNDSTYRVYLNGALVAKDVEFIPANGVNWSNVGINLPYVMEYDCNVGVRYVYDDMRIYREPVGYEKLYANDFNFYPDGTAWNGSTANANLTGVAELGLSVFGNRGATLQTSGGKLVTTANGGGAVIDSFVADESVVIEGDITIPSFTATEEKIYAPIIAVAGASNNGGIRIGVNQNGEIYSSFYQELQGLTKLGTTTLGQTHHFALYVDFVALNADLYIDGKLVYQNIGLGRYSGTATGINNGGGFAIGLGYNKETPQATISYDNLKVYRDERRAVLSELVNVVPENIEQETDLPTTVSGFNGYKVTWSSADISIENNVVTLKREDSNKTVELVATISDTQNEYSIACTFDAKTPKIVWDEDVMYQKSYLAADGTECEDPSKAAKVVVTVNDNCTYVPILVKYQNGAVVDLDIGKGKKTVEMDNTAGWGDVKFFLWKNMTNLVPVMEAENISVNGNLVFPDAENVTLSGAFSDSMVLQRDNNIKVWGYAGDDDFTKVNVSLGENSTTAYVQGGLWEAELPPMDATTESQTLTVQASNKNIVLNDILIGDVYFVGGQSNSEYRADRTDTYAADKASFTEDDNIRIFYQTSPKKENVQLDPPDGTKWEPLTESTMGKFSAIGCYFAKTIVENDGTVPIGLIQTSLGGTSLHEHVPLNIADKYEFSKAYANRSQVYNALGAPVEKFSATGLIWYQGENESGQNTVDAATQVYEDMFSDYIDHLKSVSNNDLKVFMVQLSSHTNTTTLSWNVPRMRAFQYDLANNFDHEIYMVPSLDQGVKQADIDGITNSTQMASIVAHPKYKKVIGERLANIALKVIYGKETLEPFALKYKTIDYGTDSVKIKFENVGTGLSLASGSGDTLVGFELIKDGVAYPATARIEGEDTVVLTGVTGATGVRYAFYMSAPKTAANLVNSYGIPCPTFASDLDAMKIDAISRGLME